MKMAEARKSCLLKKKGSEKIRKMCVRDGVSTQRMFGVSMADLRVIAKTIKGQKALAWIRAR
jgi:hypothetical protein